VGPLPRPFRDASIGIFVARHLVDLAAISSLENVMRTDGLAIRVLFGSLSDLGLALWCEGVIDLQSIPAFSDEDAQHVPPDVIGILTAHLLERLAGGNVGGGRRREALKFVTGPPTVAAATSLNLDGTSQDWQKRTRGIEVAKVADTRTSTLSDSASVVVVSWLRHILALSFGSTDRLFTLFDDSSAGRKHKLRALRSISNTGSGGARGGVARSCSLNVLGSDSGSETHRSWSRSTSLSGGGNRDRSIQIWASGHTSIDGGILWPSPDRRRLGSTRNVVWVWQSWDVAKSWTAEREVGSLMILAVTREDAGEPLRVWLDVVEVVIIIAVEIETVWHGQAVGLEMLLMRRLLADRTDVEDAWGVQRHTPDRPLRIWLGWDGLTTVESFVGRTAGWSLFHGTAALVVISSISGRCIRMEPR
jgi:hypothetical protein